MSMPSLSSKQIEELHPYVKYVILSNLSSAMPQKPKQTHYKVLRPILFFAKDNVVHKKTLKKYFTKKAIKSFINDEYIK